MTYSVKEVPSSKVKLVCDDCGGTQLTGTVWCTWSTERQQWVPDGNGLDENPYCDDCEERVDFHEEPVNGP